MFEYLLDVGILEFETHLGFCHWHLLLAEVIDVEFVDPFLIAFLFDGVHGLDLLLAGVVIAISKAFESGFIGSV